MRNNIIFQNVEMLGVASSNLVCLQTHESDSILKIFYGRDFEAIMINAVD